MDVTKIEITDDNDDDTDGCIEMSSQNGGCTIDLTEDDPHNDDLEIVNVYYDVDQSDLPLSNASEPLTLNDNDSITTQPAYDYSSTEFDDIGVVEEVVSSVSTNSVLLDSNSTTTSTRRVTGRRVRRDAQRRRAVVRRNNQEIPQLDATLTGENLVGEMRLSEPPRWILEPSDTEAAEYSDSNDSDAILFMGEHHLPSVSVYDFQPPRRRQTPRNTLAGNSLTRFRRRFNERKDLPRKASVESDDPVNTSTPYDANSGTLRLPVCPICQDNLTEIFTNKRQLLSTHCGHLFCSDCLPTYCSIPPKSGTQLRCPVCSASLSPGNSYHNLYW